MLKSLPGAKPDELWRIGDKIRCCNWGGYVQGDDGDFALFSWEAYKMFRDHTPEFTDLAALQAGNAPLGVRRVGSQAQADTRNGEYVSGNFFRTFGVQPWAGRLLTEADDQEGAPLVAVMSYRIWKEKYGSDPSVVGANYQINGQPFTVIGVAAPGFYGAKLAGWGMPDLWLPLTTELLIDESTSRLKRPNGNFLDLIGRVRPGVNSKALEAKLKVEFHDWLASHVPDMEPGEKQLWQQQTLHLIPGGAGASHIFLEWLCCISWARNSLYRCCTSGSDIEQLVDELNFAGDLGLEEEAMAADRPHDFKSLDGGRRCSHRLKTAGGADQIIRD
jgi:hypothetical protein